MKISAKEQQLLHIFNDAYQFAVPLYQRPYSWTTEQASELLSDLLSEMKSEESGYFLGSIVLGKAENQPDSNIIDGQQRLTTLTILIATLRDLSEESTDLNQWIWQVGSSSAGTQDCARLKIRPEDNEYFEKNIQKQGAVRELASQSSSAKLNDARKNLRENAKFFWNELESLSADERTALSQFLIQRCYLVVVATEMESVYRIFSVMNTRGLDLSPADILKAEIIGAIDDDSGQELYGKKWEAIEESLTRDNFNDLLGHLRMIFQREKSRKLLVTAFLDSVTPNPKECPKNFLDDVLEPMADAYRQIKESNFMSETDSGNINRYLRLLNRLDNKDWVPVAIYFMNRYGDDSTRVLEFLKSLEKLAYGMFVLRRNISERIKRYADVFVAIDEDASRIEESMALSDEDKSEIRRMLDGDIYSIVQIRTQILERINDAIVEDGSHSYVTQNLTVEHVLPQNPAEGSEWVRIFDEGQREMWTHRIANLVLLSRRKNSAAGNYDFETKKGHYFCERRGITPFILTSEVRSRAEWTPAVLEERQERLLRKFDEIWDLGGAS